MAMKLVGRFRKRNPAVTESLPSDFDEAAYLEAHADVRAALAKGVIVSGEAHYRDFGQREGRPLRSRVVRTIPELDAEIERLRELQQRSFSEWLRARMSFRFEEDVAVLPPDPLSDDYKAAQLKLYGQIAGVTEYNPWIAEPIPIYLPDAIDPHPFPFSTRDGELIAGHLSGLARIMQTLWKVRPAGGLSVLEYGCGTGFTTLLLAASGYKMTAVDINADVLRVIDATAATRSLKITTFNGEFGSVPDETQTFDFILFYEAFHHCLDFVPLLRTLHRRLAPGGAVIFAGESITGDFPKPWGLRLDGASLWEIRTKGWLELGFREDFFLDVLTQTGWRAEKQTYCDGPDMFIALNKGQ